MAGTTVSDENHVSLAFQLAMRNFGYALDLEEINPMMGYKKPVAIRMMLEKLNAGPEKLTDVFIEEIHAVFISNMIRFYQGSPVIALPDVEETFKELRKRGIKIGLNTGFSRDIAELIIERLDWAERIDILVASDDVERGRPYPDMIHKMMSELSVAHSEEIAKIGDTEVDVNEGINAGCKYVIGITTGAFKAEELALYHPTHIIDHITEMNLLESARKRVHQWPYGWMSVFAAIAAFSCYTSMYAFRKAFAAGTFEGSHLLGIDYKVWLVITQMIGYTLSKFYGIRFIAESSSKKRPVYLIRLILIAWTALLAFAVVPAPWNIAFMLINGFPLGMIWGLVFSYLEGRKSTEFMGALLSISLIFASGFVKTVARTMMGILPVSEFWMPFCTGLLFMLPFLLSVYCLELVPAPSPEDQLLRTKRVPMDAKQRKKFILSFFPGIVLTLVIYVLLTLLRDMRDNFEVEIWHYLHIRDNHIYTKIDLIISVAILALISLLILIRNNLKAFTVIHVMIISGCVLCGISTFAFDQGLISPVAWMCLVGMGLYMAYIPYNAIFFERMIANFHFKGNIGFIIYVADSMGYLGSAGVLMFKELNTFELSWGVFFKQTVYTVSVLGSICAFLSLVYFRQKTLSEKRKKNNAAENHNLVVAAEY
eukprot:gene15029-18197_t